MGSIIFDNLSFCYDKKTAPVLTHFSASIEAGTKTALAAPSGKGKTTLLHLIAGLLTPQEGAVHFQDTGSRISMVFQENRLIPFVSIFKNIKLVNPKLPDSEIFALLHGAGIENFADKKPAFLSGGEQRRAAIIRALAAYYDILLLDEPFSGLDNTAKQKIVRIIQDKTQGKTVILVSHNPEEIKLLGCNNTINL